MTRCVHGPARCACLPAHPPDASLLHSLCLPAHLPAAHLLNALLCPMSPTPLPGCVQQRQDISLDSMAMVARKAL